MKEILVVGRGRSVLDADFVCDGIDDQVEIRAAIEAAAPLGTVLLNGVFYIAASIEIPHGVNLRGGTLAPVG